MSLKGFCSLNSQKNVPIIIYFSFCLIEAMLTKVLFCENVFGWKYEGYILRLTNFVFIPNNADLIVQLKFIGKLHMI